MIQYTWNGQAMAIQLLDLPHVAIPLAVASLLVPLIAWKLCCRGRISASKQRSIEKTWLIALNIGAVAVWSIWGVDFCSRTSENLVTPFFFGYVVVLGLISLTAPAMRQWRKGASLTGYGLIDALLTGAFRVVVFGIYLYCTTLAVFVLLFARSQPFAYLFAPSWVGVVCVSGAIALQWLLPSICRGVLGFCRDFQIDVSAETSQLETLKTDPQPLLALAEQKIRETLAGESGKKGLVTPSFRIEVDSAQHVSQTHWIVSGKLYFTNDLPTQRDRTWRVYISLIVGNLRVTQVTFAATQRDI